MVIFTQDKKKLHDHFKKDHSLFAYHIGDLDDFDFQHCQWGATYGLSPRIDDVILIYNALTVPTVLAFGISSRFEELIREIIPILPSKFHCHFFEKDRLLFDSLTIEKNLGGHLKMSLESFTQYKKKPEDGKIVRLDESHRDQLQALYTHAYPDTYFNDRMLATGKYLGYKIENKLVAVTGVHVYSKEYKVASLGNIATHPQYRGKGISTWITSQLLSELSDEKIFVGLNVKADNKSAIASYTKLGFTTTHEYQEALFSL